MGRWWGWSRTSHGSFKVSPNVVASEKVGEVWVGIGRQLISYRPTIEVDPHQMALSSNF